MVCCCVCPPEDHSHAPDDQPIELEAPLAGGERGQSKLRKLLQGNPFNFVMAGGKIGISSVQTPKSMPKYTRLE